MLRDNSKRQERSRTVVLCQRPGLLYDRAIFENAILRFKIFIVTHLTSNTQVYTAWVGTSKAVLIILTGCVEQLKNFIQVVV
jgi:hypothetical protein